MSDTGEHTEAALAARVLEQLQVVIDQWAEAYERQAGELETARAELEQARLTILAFIPPEARPPINPWSYDKKWGWCLDA